MERRPVVLHHHDLAPRVRLASPVNRRCPYLVQANLCSHAGPCHFTHSQKKQIMFVCLSAPAASPDDPDALLDDIDTSLSDADPVAAANRRAARAATLFPSFRTAASGGSGITGAANSRLGGDDRLIPGSRSRSPAPSVFGAGAGHLDLGALSNHGEVPSSLVGATGLGGGRGLGGVQLPAQAPYLYASESDDDDNDVYDSDADSSEDWRSMRSLSGEPEDPVRKA